MSSCGWLVILGQVLLVLCSKAQTLETNTYCVSERSCNTTLSDSCTLCQPLMWFVNETQTIPNNSMIVFLPGNHSLNSRKEQHNAVLNFFNKENLTLKGIGIKKEVSTVVCSGRQSGFSFQSSSNIAVSNLRFQDCGARMTNNFYGCIFFDFSHSVTISNVSVNGCKGFGIHTNNVYGSMMIQHSNFTGSKSGNAVFWFKRFNSTATYLDIYNSQFSDGTTKTQNATGINLIILRSGVKVFLKKLKLINNKGRFGGNLAIKFLDYARNMSKVSIEDCQIEGGHAQTSGGGMIVQFEKTWQSDSEVCKRHKNFNKNVVAVSNTTFTGNTAGGGGGGVLVTYHERPGTGCTIRHVKFKGCNFTNNTAKRGSALEVSKHKIPMHVVHNSPQFSVTLHECLIKNNYLAQNGDQSNEEGIAEIFSVEKLVIVNSTFINNNGTALMLVGSGVQFYDETVFENNSAEYGGAIKLCDSSVMYFNNHSRVKLLNNSAHSAGGAIYARNQCLQETPPCFFQMSFSLPNNPPFIEDMAEGILYFKSNRAGIAGKAIYGGSVDNCFTDTELRLNSSSNASFYNSLDLFHQIFSFMNEESSLVTSDPYGVCLCDETTIKTNCTHRQLHLPLFAGEFFTVHVSAVGQTNGSVPSKILIDYGQNNSFRVQKLGRESQPYVLCHTLTLAILPEKNISNVTFKLGVLQTNAVSESSNYYRIPKLTVNVEIHPCPFLFELNKTNSCNCPQHLKNNGIECEINTEAVIRTALAIKNKVWIGCTYTENATDDKCKTVSMSKSCQQDRCSDNAVFTRSNLSEICVEGREGRMCGKCKPEYSLSLGPLNCLPTERNCSIWWTVLLSLFFILSGILLVCFLAIFNLTVSEGTINGLLFYANCIHANQDAFYESSVSFSRVFISWLNLDFGFPVCLYSGMTAYQKVWLELGFLLYLFLLGVLIVCLSRKFIWFTRLTGRSVVPVLSTIILIAHPKLVRNCIKVWQCHNGDYWSSDHFTPLMWQSDETIDCFSPKHLILFIVSILLFTVAFLYTLCLLFIQCLQRGSGWCVLRWVNKLRPFFDANTGPCRDHYRFWPGFLLSARLGIYAVIGSHTNLTEKVSVILGLCILIFFLACVSPHGVYKKWPLNLLEFSFVLNLGIATGPVALKNGHTFVISRISIAIAFFTFLLILVYHTYKKLRETKRWKKMVAKVQERRIKHRMAKRQTDAESVPTETSSLIRPGQGMPPVIKFTAPREPLLEDD